MKRKLIAVHSAQATVDGDGVDIQRISTQHSYANFDPFLMLDEFKGGFDGKQTQGFPQHPHRGFETVTYMLDGAIEHRDHLGNVGRLQSGGIQWMTAGRGVLHSEMPIAEKNYFHGFQIWVNLPAAQKMTAPKYRELSAAQIPQLTLHNSNCIKVIAGDFALEDQAATGPIKDVATQPDYWDVHMQPQTEITLPVAEHKRALIYVYEGAVEVPQGEQSTTILAQQMAIFSTGDPLLLHSSCGGKFLLLAAEPINEPVVSWGPFVMNTREEIDQAIHDYRNGILVQ